MVPTTKFLQLPPPIPLPFTRFSPGLFAVLQKLFYQHPHGKFLDWQSKLIFFGER